MKKLTFLSVGRSDYGIMRNIILASNQHKKINLSLIITGSHLSKKFGNTIGEIKKDKIKNIYKINLDYSFKNLDKTNYYISSLIDKTDKILKRIKPDFVVVLGDRYEMLAMSLAAFNNNIKIIHFCGGSKTLGVKDDEYRKCITNLSSYHFVETILHKEQLLNYGIDKNTIFVSGAPALENLKKIKFQKKNSLLQNMKIKNYKNYKIIIVTFHPETKNKLSNNIKYINELLKFLKSLKKVIIIMTYPNADFGYENIIKIIEKTNFANFYKFKSLGIEKYFNVLKYGDCLIGNSSSGIIESKSFNLPTINLGERQRKRFHNKNVIHSRIDKTDLKDKYFTSQTKKFKKSFYSLKDIYRLNYTSEKVVDLLIKLN
tara:strand:- start:266 stop:1384 length:1119 start_codon:yes stop_codon:yes gene_type:complete